MKSNHTKGNWIKGKGGWCVITDDKSEIDLEKRDTPDSIDYYGGALICESVKDKDINIISAAPELLKSCQDFIHWYGKRDKEENLLPINQQDPQVKQAIEAVNKALGNE